MLIDTACSVAFYCQCCGRIHLFDVPLFSGKRHFTMECADCGHKMGEISMRPKKGLIIKTRCGVCGGENSKQFSYRQLKRINFEKLYCQHDNFELGYIGKWQNIAEFLDFNAAEYDALHPSDADGFLEHQQTLLEALNRVHDLARHGELICLCGSAEISAGIAKDEIILECAHCGSYCIVPARTKEDLERLLPGRALSLEWRPHTFLDVWGK